MHKILSSILLMGLLVTPCWGYDVPVIDLTNIMQTTISAVKTTETAINTAKSVVNEWNIIRNQITDLERNLTRLPKGLNLFEEVQGYGNRLAVLFNGTQGLSFDLTQSVSQFDRLYQQTQTLRTSSDVRSLRESMLASRLGARALTGRSPNSGPAALPS